MLHLRYIGILLGTTSYLVGNAQQLNYPLEFTLNNAHSARILTQDEYLHTGFKPMNRHFTGTTLEPVYADSLKVYYEVTAKLYKEHLVEVAGADYNFFIDPLFNFEIGLDVSDTSGRGTIKGEGGTFHTNTRGFQVGGTINKKFSFYTSFYENQSFFPDYLRIFNNSRGEYYWSGTTYRQQLAVVPGQGRAKDFKETGFDYAMASGYIAYAVQKNVQLQFGHGKHFIGEGYRSLLLSDNAFNYPYWQIRTGFFKNRLHYNFSYAYLLNLYRLPEHSAPEASFIKKNMNFSYVSFCLTPKTEIGLFEGVIWNRYDTTTGISGAPAISYTPLPLGAALNGFDDAERNVVVGLTIRQSITRKAEIYGQIMLDDPKTSKYGFQIGGKLFDPFKLKGLTVVSELNKVNAFSYSSRSIWTSYSHYNQELAHPYGAGFTEFVFYANYLHKSRFWASYKLNLAVMPGTWTVPDNGKAVLSPYLDNELTSDDRARLGFHEIKIGYRCNVKTNMNVFLGVNYRNFKDDQKNLSTYVHVGVKTGLINRYYDF